MEKLTYLRTSKDANALFSQIKELGNVLKTPGTKPRLMKVQVSDNPDETVVLWSIKISEDNFFGADICGNTCHFNRRQIVNWLPYHGQLITENQSLFFDIGGEPYIEILLVAHGKEAEQILRKEFPIIHGSLIMVSSYQFPEDCRSYKKLQYYWAMRIDMHHYAALNPFTDKTLMLDNFGDGLKNTFRCGDNIGEYYALAEDENEILFLRHRK